MNLYKIYRKGTKKEVARVRAHNNYCARFKYALLLKRLFSTADKSTDFIARKIKE